MSTDGYSPVYRGISITEKGEGIGATPLCPAFKPVEAPLLPLGSPNYTMNITNFSVYFYLVSLQNFVSLI